MGINNLAVQTFSSSGSQSVCRANKADSSRQITSEFISRPSMTYINGSGLSVINGTINSLPYGTTSSGNTSETFRIPNNIDSISDMVLNMDLTISKPTATDTFSCGGIYYSKTFLLDLIKNVEIKMGGLIIQTILPGDIYMRNYSELGEVISQENSFTNISDDNYIDTGSIIGHATTSVEEIISFSLSIPFIGRSSDKSRSFLQTGSFTKNLVVTVNYNRVSQASQKYLNIIPLLQTASTTADKAITTLSTKLCILSHIITDTEKNFLKQNIINRVINTSVGISIRNVSTGISLSTGITAINVDLDAIDLNVTHLLFCLNVNIFSQGSDELPSQFMRNATALETITPSVLSTASAYVTGDTKLSSSWGKASIDTNITTAAIANPDVLGVFDGWLSSAELILGTETTGEIPCSILTSNQPEFKLINVKENFYILKLADNAFSTAGVPFSRIKNKKLILNVRNKFFNKNIVAIPTAGGTTSTPITTVTATPIGPYAQYRARDATISVCACGTTLQIINNNTVSFSYI